MLLGPAKTKFKREHRNKISGYEARTSSTTLRFGVFGIQACENAIISPQQLEAARKAVVRTSLGRSKTWFRLLPATIITSKPKGVRMGRGKGSWKNYAFKVRRGRVIFEVGGILAREVYKRVVIAGHKMPMLTKIMISDGFRRAYEKIID